MKPISRHRTFKKNFLLRINSNKKLRRQFEKRLNLFVSGERGNPINDHALTGSRKGQRSFLISADIRVIYTETKDTILFLDIGTHNQIYN